MNDDPAHPPVPEDRTRFQVDRLAFFSDAVFAIAITLLALNIHAPAIVGPEDEHALVVAARNTVPQVLGFLLSFLVIGNYWRSHHRLFRWVRDYNPRLVTINLWLLLFVSFIPAPTAFYSAYPNFRTPLVIYAVTLSAIGVTNAALWTYVRRHPGMLDPAAPPFDLRVGVGRSLLIPALCLLAIGLSYVSLSLAGPSLLFIPLWSRLYTYLMRRWHERRKPPTTG